MTIQAFKRSDGRVGVRNHVVVIPTSVCASVTAQRIAAAVPGTISLTHQHGCCQVGADFDQTVRTLAGMGRNPNVAAALVVSLGCEGVPASALTAPIAACGTPVQSLTIQESGGEQKTIEAGIGALTRLKAVADTCRREPCSLADVILGMECGGSDSTSGIASNPVIGILSDLLIEAGGTSILSETTELIGAEHTLAHRARTREVAERLIHIVQRTERRALLLGADLRGSQPTPGNIDGGITTLAEKSLGCAYKAGTATIEGVLEYGQAPAAQGLFVMDTPGQDIESITGMVAGGAQVCIFSTGRGSPTGCPIAPVIKISANERTCRVMADSVDFDASGVITRGERIRDLGLRLMDEFVAVCNGRLTSAEVSGHNELAIFRVGHTF
jgi:altronate dehydratase large subunit